MGHVQGAQYHLQTPGKIEQYHRTMKNVVKLENYYFPDDLRANIQAFMDYYNHRRYHESLRNVTSADLHFGRDKEILHQGKTLKFNP